MRSGWRPARDRATRQLELGRIGESAKRADAVLKTTGEFAYSSDLYATGMLWGHTLRSLHVHARIVEIDLSDALTVPGVHAVLTHEDVPGQKRWRARVPRSAGARLRSRALLREPVAVVAAEDPEQARRAAERIRIEHGSPIPWSTSSERRSSRRFIDRLGRIGHGYLDDPRPNVLRHIVIRHGDPDAQGAVSVSGYYELGQQDQAFLGPESGLAVPDGEGGVGHLRRHTVAPRRPGPDRPAARSRPERVRIHRWCAARSAAVEDLSMRSTARCSRCTRTAP